MNNFQQQTQPQAPAPVQPHHGVLPPQMQPQGQPAQQQQTAGFPQAGQTNFPFPMK